MLQNIRARKGRVIQSGILTATALSLILTGVPMKTVQEGKYELVDSYYKDENKEQLQTYEWSEILIEKKRYQLPSSYTKDGTTYSYEGFKTFEDTNKITFGEAGQINRNSTTNELGIQTLNDRYLVAVGTYFNLQIGQYFDLVLENGTVIPCVLGDTKADVDTCNSNIFTVHSNCMSEFIVQTDALPNEVQQKGDISFAKPEWNSPVKEVITYENVHLEELK